MEQCEKEIINTNLDKLIENTYCNPMVLAKLESAGVFSDADVNALNTYSSNRMEQVTQFYKLIQTKSNGYKILLRVLEDTKQSGALSTLIPPQNDNSFRYDNDTKARLGKGKFGTVFKGEWKNRIVAVKRIIHTDEMEKARIENEVEILLKCDGHENIVRYFTTKNFEYFDLIVLELCDMTLKQSIEDKTKVQIPRRKIMNKVTTGLEWLHEQKILYCNLKPENVLLKTSPPGVKLSGFGSSVQLKDGKRSHQVNLHEIPETLGFDAPEAKGNCRECTFASDVYSLGSLFYFVLTDGKSNLKELESLDLEDTTMDETNEAKNFVDDIVTIKNMTSDDPKSRPSSSQLLSSPMLHERNCDETQETDDFNHTNDPPLLRFIKQIKIETENKINGIPSGKSKQPKYEKTLEAEHKIEKMYQILENLKQLDPVELRKHGQLEKLKDAELRVFEKFTETVGAKLEIKFCKQDEEKNPYLMQKDSQDETIANDDSEDYESCDDSSFTELHESLITNSVGKFFPCVDDEQQEKIQQTLDEPNEMDLRKTRIKLFELVKSERFCFVKLYLNSLAAQAVPIRASARPGEDSEDRLARLMAKMIHNEFKAAKLHAM